MVKVSKETQVSLRDPVGSSGYVKGRLALLTVVGRLALLIVKRRLALLTIEGRLVLLTLEGRLALLTVEGRLALLTVEGRLALLAVIEVFQVPLGGLLHHHLREGGHRARLGL